MAGPSKDIQVAGINVEVGKVLQRDSEMEMELLELFEDITLEEVVANKACVGKVIGCKDMPTSVVKKILTGVWRRLGPWRMKKCEDGVMGFFFDNEIDCEYVMEKRPWLVNGVLLNLKPWPVEGEVKVAEFEVARFWVQFHGLPVRCLSNDNASIIAKKVGSFVNSDGKQREELVRRGFLKAWVDVWMAHSVPAGFFLTADGKPESCIQFKYEKLPLICFNCGRLAHWDKVCKATTAMVIPKEGKAVNMYGTWIKSDTGRSNCFTMGGKGFSKFVIDCDNGPEWDRGRFGRKGTWKRRTLLEDQKKVQTNITVGSLEQCPSGETSGGACMQKDKDVRAMSGDAIVRIHTSSGNVADTEENVGEVVAEVAYDEFQNVQNEGNRDPLGPDYLALPQPDFAHNENNLDLIPDIGPTIAQTLEIPHDWVCLSQKPHLFPEPTPLPWPNQDSEAQQMKRKAHTWYHPVPTVTNFELPPCPLQLNGEPKVDENPQFCIGSNEEPKDNGSKKIRGRGRKSYSKRHSGVKTRSGRRKKEAETAGDTIGNLSEILNKCVEVTVEFVPNFGNGEEAAVSMPPPSS
ncbi:hypothetical protein G4B88_015894 [Cannabis sativa]|uniref:CCHC-type domain-containing protein n=1 Tax=Cannabis sativa TaxID=3483 RepID=A0A7J6G5Q0_CANSA|nr:hypothetical protein G4B88_015894 [Cannabis sativa]